MDARRLDQVAHIDLGGGSHVTSKLTPRFKFDYEAMVPAAPSGFRNRRPSAATMDAVRPSIDKSQAIADSERVSAALWIAMRLDQRPPDEVPRLPLGRFPLFATRDFDEAVALGNLHFHPHRLEARRVVPFNCRLNMAAMGRINFSYFEYGPEVTLIAPETEQYYFIQVPISGTLHLSIGGREAILSPGQVTMLNPFRGVRLCWSRSAQMVVRIDRRLLDAAVARHLPGYTGPCIDFDETTIPSVAQTQGVRDLVWLICRQIEICNSPMMGPSTQQHLTDLLLATILYTFPHNLRDRLSPRLPHVVPGYVKRVEAFIRANAHRTVRLQDLVAVAGVSERSLQYGFRRFRGAGPMQVLKAVRLDRVRCDLLNSAEGRNSITDIALKWGFVHHGNFARDYRRRFGENPARTRAISS